jgi:peptidoglycan/xylan/chitin deacetylase (PgdA/CDA1 family)
VIQPAKSLAESIIRWSPAQLVFKIRARQRLTVLGYHGVDDPDRFERQLQYVCRAMRPVSQDDVLDAMAGRRDLPPRAVLISFDDGDRSVVDVAMSMMQERGLPGIAFVIAGLLDTDQPYWWVEVKDLVASGATSNGNKTVSPEALVTQLKRVSDDRRLAIVEELRRTARIPAAPRVGQLLRSELPTLENAGIAVGNHTLTHPRLDQCDDDKVQHEILESHRILAAALGHPPRAFAYPDGAADPRAVAHLAAAGYEMAFLFDHRVGDRVPTDPFRISRVRVNASSRMDRFAAIASGLHPALYHRSGYR